MQGAREPWTYFLRTRHPADKWTQPCKYCRRCSGCGTASNAPRTASRLRRQRRYVRPVERLDWFLIPSISIRVMFRAPSPGAQRELRWETRVSLQSDTAVAAACYLCASHPFAAARLFRLRCCRMPPCASAHTSEPAHGVLRTIYRWKRPFGKTHRARRARHAPRSAAPCRNT